MKNIIKKMFIYLVFIVSIGIVAVSMYHYSLTQKEEAILRNKGMMVNIDGQSMNVYREGAGEDTYVFMAGSGIEQAMALVKLPMMKELLIPFLCKQGRLFWQAGSSRPIFLFLTLFQDLKRFTGHKNTQKK